MEVKASRSRTTARLSTEAFQFAGFADPGNLFVALGISAVAEVKPDAISTGLNQTFNSLSTIGSWADRGNYFRSFEAVKRHIWRCVCMLHAPTLCVFKA